MRRVKRDFVTLVIRVGDDTAGYLDRMARDGNWSSRGAMIRSLLEEVVRDDKAAESET